MIALIFSLGLSLIMGLLVIFGFNRKGPGPASGFVFSFLVIFIFTWSIGSWLVPIGPKVGEFSWIGYFLLALVVMLLLGALLPRTKPRNRIIRKKDLEKEIMEDKVIRSLDESFNVFFWIMIATFLIIATMRYFFLPF